MKDRVCMLVCLCAFRGTMEKSRKDACLNLLLMEEASKASIKKQASVKLEDSHGEDQTGSRPESCSLVTSGS